MKSLRLSIVIPVYNVEKYLVRCLDSLVFQMNNEVEIVLVDDESTDSSWLICKKYSDKYENVLAVKQKHSGLSAARNMGIKYSKGEYIGFVDSDDYVGENYFGNILKVINNVHLDIIIFNFAFQYSNRLQQSKNYNSWNNGKIAKKNVINTLPNSSYAWNKIYRRSLFRKVQYPIGQYYEDVNTTYKLVDQSKTFFYIDKVMYYYVQRSSSIMHHSSKKKVVDNLLANLQLYKFLKNNGYAEVTVYQRQRLTLFAFSYCLICNIEKDKIAFKKAQTLYIKGDMPKSTSFLQKTSIKLCQRIPSLIYVFRLWQIARNNLNKFSNADYAKRSQSVFANLNI